MITDFFFKLAAVLPTHRGLAVPAGCTGEQLGLPAGGDRGRADTTPAKLHFTFTFTVPKPREAQAIILAELGLL